MYMVYLGLTMRSQKSWFHDEIAEIIQSVPEADLERMKLWAHKHGLPEPKWYVSLDMDCDVKNTCACLDRD
jgi:hypothetical protein